MVYRKLTNNDWNNINRPVDSISGGGGQLYIDFPKSAITVQNWRDFFAGITEGARTIGPQWTFTLRSLGAFQGIQNATIFQRRDATFSITEQNIHSTNSNRIFAWTPSLTSFPFPDDIENITSAPDSLYVYIVRLQNGEHWAGWFQSEQPQTDWYVNNKLNSIFSSEHGFLVFDDEPIVFDISNFIWPFTKP